MAKKIGIAASVAGILGVVISFYSTFVVSNEQPRINQTINGTKNTVIGKTSGSVIINYNSELDQQSKLVLKRTLPVTSIPNLFATIQDTSKHICKSAYGGTSVTLTGKEHNENGLHLWKQVKINNGECSGKIGWVPGYELEYR